MKISNDGYLVFTDEFMLPTIHGARALQWKLRYAQSDLTRGEALVIADILSFYAKLVELPEKQRNEKIRFLRRADREFKIGAAIDRLNDKPFSKAVKA